MSNLKEFNALMRMDYTQNYLRDVLGDKAQTFVTSLTDIVSNDKMLQACDPNTIMFAGITAASMDLPLNKNLGYAYVIPYGNRDGKVAQFQMGYKGFVQLAMRSGQFARINATDVREGELKGFNRLTGDITFDWDDNPERINKKVIGYVAYFRLINGFSKSMYMSVEEVEHHAKRYSQTYKSSNDNVRKNSKWATDFDAMAKKTVLKLLLSKYAPLSLEMQTAVSADQSVQHDAGAYTYVDNDKETAKVELAEKAKERLAEDADFMDVSDNTIENEKAKDNEPNVNDLPFEEQP